MATSKQSAEVDEENRVSKTVTLVGYIPEEYDTAREWADDVDDHDYYEEKEESKTDYFIGGDESGEREIEEEIYNLLEGQDLEGVELREEVHTWTDYKYSAYLPLREQLKGYTDSLVDNLGLPEDLDTEFYRTTINSLESDFYCAFILQTDKIPLLKHTEDMEPDDMYVEGSEERPVIKVRVKVKDCPESWMDTIDAGLIADVANWMATDAGFERVRMAKCEKETVEKWSCLRV